AVVVEGYTDVLALHQAGIEEAVGVMGTAITPDQVGALSGMVEEVVLALDADSAGQEAMLRAQTVAAGRRMRLRVAAMPAGEDPAEMMAAAEGAERMAGLLERAEELVAFQVGLVLERTDAGNPVERDRALAEVAPVLAGMGESASRDDLVRRVAERLDFEPAMVMGRVVAATPASGGPEQAPAPSNAAPARPQRAAELTSRERRERALLAMCIAIPNEGKEYLARLTEAHLSPTGLRAAAWLREHPEDPASDLPHDDSALAGLIAELVIMSREEPASHEAMELNFLLLEQRRLEAEIAAAGERGDYERRAALSRERAALVQRIAHAERPAGSV
ncbi:MAG TPA: toprim domain-containing protein, partial [Solirubrobacterales bacterium]|nr:toprim domain-containing protein [Solirubrobacterales bacterium]